MSPWGKNVNWTDVCIAIFTAVLAVLAILQTLILAKTVEMSRNDQRAWVGAADMSTPEVQWGSRLKLSIPLSNSGRTPARHVKIEFDSSVNPRGKTFKADYRPNADAGPQSVPVIQPGARHYINAVRVQPFTGEEESGIGSGEMLLVVYGRITYDDVFGRNHKTTFAYRWVPALSVWRALDTNNDAD